MRNFGIQLAMAGIALTGMTATPGMAREEIISLEVFQSLSTSNPSIAPKINLNNLIQAAGKTLRGKTVRGASVTAGGFGTLFLDAGGTVRAQGFLDPMVGFGVVELQAGQPIPDMPIDLRVNGDMFIETVDLRVESAPIIINPPVGPKTVRLNFFQNLGAGASTSHRINAGHIQRLRVKWTDWTEGAKADFYIANQLVAKDVDVGSSGSLKNVDIDRAFPDSMLEIRIKHDPMHLEYIEVDYAGGTPPVSLDQTIQVDREFNNGEYQERGLNSGHLETLRFSWTDWMHKAKAEIYLIDNVQGAVHKGTLDVNSNDTMRELPINQWIAPGTRIGVRISGDRAHIRRIEADFQ